MCKTKILAISRDPVLLGFFKQHLTGSDYEMAVSEDAGREMLDEHHPDLILLDIMMPSLDGIEVCLRIRQWCQVPIIMLSCWGAGDRQVRGLDLGAEGYLTEPFGINELKSRIQGADERVRLTVSCRRRRPWAA